jgi:hypothetical protein
MVADDLEDLRVGWVVGRLPEVGEWASALRPVKLLKEADEVGRVRLGRVGIYCVSVWHFGLNPFGCAS